MTHAIPKRASGGHAVSKLPGTAPAYKPTPPVNPLKPTMSPQPTVVEGIKAGDAPSGTGGSINKAQWTVIGLLGLLLISEVLLHPVLSKNLVSFFAKFHPAPKAAPAATNTNAAPAAPTQGQVGYA